MIGLTYIIDNYAHKTGLRLVLVALLTFVSLFSYARVTNPRVHYTFDNASLRSGYLGNDLNISTIDSVAAIVSDDPSRGIEIVSFSSPEGPYSYNVALAARRAETLRSYIVSRHPALDGRVSTAPSGESWEQFRSFVESDSNLSSASRDAVLSIIDSADAPDVKERRLGGVAVYKYLYSSYFRKLRYAELRLVDVAAVASGSSAAAVADNTDNTDGADSNAAKSEASESAAASSASGAASGSAAVSSAVAVSGTKDSPVVHYRLRSSELDNEYLSNAQSLMVVRELLAGRSADEVESIDIVSTSSIEGPVAVNNSYAQKRGEALRNYIVSVYPELAGKINVRNAGETWEEFRKAVEADPVLTEESRSEILSIIVSNTAPDSKEARIRKMPEWDHLFEDILPGTRFAKLSAKFKEQSAEPAQTVEPAQPAEPVSDKTDSTVVAIPDVVADTDIKVDDEQVTVYDPALKVDEGKTDIPAVAQTVASKDSTVTDNQVTEKAFERRPLLAASTNLLFDAVTALNVSVAVPIGKSWSVRAEYINPWWVWDHNTRALEIQHLSFGARYYPRGTFLGMNFGDPASKRVLTGWYLEGMFGTGKYDLEPYRRGWQGEEWMLQLGGGYSFRLGDHWSLDLGIGFGPMQTGYRYYESNKDDTKLIYKYSGRYSWLGPTNVRASLTYLFYYKKHLKKEVRGE